MFSEATPSKSESRDSWRDDFHVRRADENPGSPQILALWRGYQQNPGSGSLTDPFAVNPIRRAFVLVTSSTVAVVGPSQLEPSPLLALTWLAIPGLVFGLPVLGMCLLEFAVSWIRGLLYPTIDQLELSPRVHHLLARCGYVSIDQLQTAPDEELLLITNLHAGGLHEVRRAITLWSYRRWQEQGFRGACR